LKDKMLLASPPDSLSMDFYPWTSLGAQPPDPIIGSSSALAIWACDDSHNSAVYKAQDDAPLDYAWTPS